MRLHALLTIQDEIYSRYLMADATMPSALSRAAHNQGRLAEAAKAP